MTASAPSSSLDCYGIEELITDEERAVRDRARRLVQEEAMLEIGHVLFIRHVDLESPHRK